MLGAPSGPATMPSATVSRAAGMPNRSAAASRSTSRAAAAAARGAGVPRTASSGCRTCPCRTVTRRCCPSPPVPRPGAPRAPRRPACPSAVRVPWPASTLPVKAVTEPSAPTCTQASSGPPHRPWPGPSAGPVSSATTVTRPSGSLSKNGAASLAWSQGGGPAARDPVGGRRASIGPRDRLQQFRLIHELGGPADRAQDPRIRAAPAHVPGQLGGDPGVIRVRHPVEQRGRGGEPARGAVPALHRAGLQPGLLHRVQQAVLGKPFDRRDPLAGDLGRRRGARGHRAPAESARCRRRRRPRRSPASGR